MFLHQLYITDEDVPEGFNDSRWDKASCEAEKYTLYLDEEVINHYVKEKTKQEIDIELMEKMFDAKEKLKQEKNFQGNIGFEDIMEQHEKMGVIVNTSPYRPGNFAASRPDYGFALYMLIYFHDRQVSTNFHFLTLWVSFIIIFTLFMRKDDAICMCFLINDIHC